MGHDCDRPRANSRGPGSSYFPFSFHPPGGGGLFCTDTDDFCVGKIHKLSYTRHVKRTQQLPVRKILLYRSCEYKLTDVVQNKSVSVRFLDKYRLIWSPRELIPSLSAYCWTRLAQMVCNRKMYENIVRYGFYYVDRINYYVIRYTRHSCRHEKVVLFTSRYLITLAIAVRPKWNNKFTSNVYNK